MNNTVGNILNFFADTSKSLGARVGTIVVSIALLFFIDLVSGLTYNFQMNNKLSQIEKINQLKNVYKTDNEKLYSLKLIENKILLRHHYSEIVLSLFVSAIDLTADNPNEPNNKVNNSLLDIKLMILSSSYSLVLLIPLLIIAPFFSNQKFDTLIGSIAVIILLLTTIAVITALSYLIPVIDNEKPYWNYLINIGIHSIFLIWLLRMVNKK